MSEENDLKGSGDFGDQSFPPPPADCHGIPYTVRPGDTLFTIARMFGTPLADIIAANPQITNPNLIFPGQVICVPLPPPPATCTGFRYIVAPGDTLTSISRRFGVPVSQIRAANPQIVDPNVIFAGQVICIPIPVRPDIECDGFLYTIAPGETLGQIALRFGITVSRILAVNPQIINPNIVFAGQVICIPVNTLP